ncbi:MAG: hypothetical protein WCW01_02145 [Gammaproteobacteria bacterium]
MSFFIEKARYLREAITWTFSTRSEALEALEQARVVTQEVYDSLGSRDLAVKDERVQRVLARFENHRVIFQEKENRFNLFKKASSLFQSTAPAATVQTPAEESAAGPGPSN